MVATPSFVGVAVADPFPLWTHPYPTGEAQLGTVSSAGTGVSDSGGRLEIFTDRGLNLSFSAQLLNPDGSLEFQAPTVSSPGRFNAIEPALAADGSGYVGN